VAPPLNGAPLSPAEQISGGLGATPPAQNDPAFQKPRDPLADARIRETADVIYRDIPIVTISTAWSPGTTRAALASLMVGLFNDVSQLIDSALGDSRVQSALASRIGGLLGRPIDFEAANDSDAAKECRDAFKAAWPRMTAEPVLSDLQTWNVMLGFGMGQILWDTEGEYAIPIPRPWHPRFTYYHWIYRCYVAVTQDCQVPVVAGDGHWILHAAHGEYRGWMYGAIRAIAPWWLARNYALRDFARWSERNGMPILKAITPAAGDPTMIAAFRAALTNIGQETCIQLPQGVDGRPDSKYDVAWLESNNAAFEGFIQLIGTCDREITLALLAQILTTDVGPEGRGSYAAARVHADVRQALLEADARALEDTIHRQLGRPFAAMNFGDPELAPKVRWNVKPYEDDETAATTLLKVTQAIVNLANAGHKVEDPAGLLRSFGINLGKLKEVEPALGAVAEGGGSAPPKRPEGSNTVAPAAPSPRREDARARFAALAETSLRLRLAAGTTEEQIREENAAIEAMLAEQEQTAKQEQRAA